MKWEAIKMSVAREIFTRIQQCVLPEIPASILVDLFASDFEAARERDRRNRGAVGETVAFRPGSCAASPASGAAHARPQAGSTTTFVFTGVRA